MKKVCFLVSSLGSLGGAGRVVANVANRMASDYEVHVLGTYGGTKQQPAFPLDDRIAHMNFFEEEGRLRETAKALRRPLSSYLREHGIDVVFLVGNYQGFMALPTILSSKAKFVFCDHGALMNQWDQRDVRTIRRLCSRFCDATVALTEQSRRDYIERFHLKPARVTAIYNWIPDSQVQAAPGYDASSKKIIWAGRLDPEKGVDFMLDIAAKVLPSRPDWTWDVFGKAVIADGDEAWPEKVRSLGLEGRLNIKGPVSDLYGRYPDYGICTLTSYREGLPMVLLEAAANAIPSVSFDVQTGPREIIDDGVNGYLAPCYDCDAFAEKLGRLMDDAALRQRFSDAMPATLDKFSEERIYAQWRALVASLCGVE